jgi:hypothetical protein
VAAARAEQDRAAQVQREIWRDVVAGLALPGAPAALAVLPPINEMFDPATTRLVAVPIGR